VPTLIADARVVQPLVLYNSSKWIKGMNLDHNKSGAFS